MKITIPLPDRNLGPNARIHWSRKQALTRRHRQMAKVLTRAVAGGIEPPPFTGYTLAFFYPNARRRDDDNAIAATKAYRDGIADALHMDDFNLHLAGVPTFAIDRQQPRLEINLL